MRRGHTTLVIFHQTEQEFGDFIACYYSQRRNAHSDLYASAELIFIPLLYEGLYRMDAEDLASMSLLVERAGTNELFQFYFLLLKKINNPLVMNLFWETLFFWGFPFSKREGRPDQYAIETVRKRLSRLIDGARLQSWESVRNALIEFQRSDRSAITTLLDQYATALPKEEQIPFVWRIYRNFPQICFELSVRILYEIYIGKYRGKAYLPSYAKIAEEYQVSVSTARRTIASLHQLGAVQPINGKGIRICLIGDPCQPADFSNPVVRRNLSFYIQAFDLARYTCEGVTRNFILTLPSEVKGNLITQLEEEFCMNHCIVSIFHFLRCITDHDRLQGVRAIYGVICSFLLWGVPLLGSNGGTSKMASTSEHFTQRILQCLRENDANGCASAVKGLFDGQLAAAEDFLIRQGISPEELRQSPSISFLITDTQIF